MIRKTIFAASALLVLFSAGCANDGGLYRPAILHPGDIRSQRIRATVHDPYPNQDTQPAIPDGRPRDYQAQAPAPVRNRFFTESLWGTYGTR